MTILHRCIEAYEQGCRSDWDDDDGYLNSIAAELLRLQ